MDAASALLILSTALSTAAIWLCVIAIRTAAHARRVLATCSTLRPELDSLDAEVKALGKNHRRLRGAFYGKDGGRPRRDDDEPEEDAADDAAYTQHMRALRLS